ncbi:MAG: hypothetical protein A3F67_02865 [Verrucomicrobia bacterium RIFCSPHIGHO2_12_FULL_41_10]|nr:MAG: hypothetical protein A3F67_02865 [Verrucomicrobia bacterium RIFCSPHIGHO2_12_FULL_41_10]HLB33285.1 histidine phosphatase family protein [Chthoniobacterales bacterium]
MYQTKIKITFQSWFTFRKTLFIGLFLLSSPPLLRGDSSSPSPSLTAPSYHPDKNQTEVKKKEKLIFAIDVIRHGDRNPLIDIPKAPHHWAEGLGQLTPLGMRQEYELGKKFHHRYIDREKLLPRFYQPETLYVRSSDIDRTLMSAQSVLMGLYPPGSGPLIGTSFFTKRPALPNRFQPVPIHTVPKKQDSLLIPDNKVTCNFYKLVKTIVASSPAWKQKEAEIKPHFAAWSKATGIQVTDELQFILLGDTLLIDQLKHIPLPQGLTHDDVTTILKANAWRCAAVFKNRTIGQASGGRLLHEIAHYLKKASQQKTSLKYVLYSAHDATILSLMSAMKAPLTVSPPYASDLNISLYLQGNDHYEVKVTMNDQPVQLPCSRYTTCSLEEFMALAQLFGQQAE